MQTQGTLVFCRSAKEPSVSYISYVPLLRTSSPVHPTLSVCKHIIPSKRGRSERKRKGRRREGERKRRRGKKVVENKMRDGIEEWKKGEEGRRGEGGKRK